MNALIYFVFNSLKLLIHSIVTQQELAMGRNKKKKEKI